MRTFVIGRVTLSCRRSRHSHERQAHLCYMHLGLSGIRIPLRPRRYYASTILTKTLSTVCRLAFRGTCLFRKFCGFTISTELPHPPIYCRVDTQRNRCMFWSASCPCFGLAPKVPLGSDAVRVASMVAEVAHVSDFVQWGRKRMGKGNRLAICEAIVSHLHKWTLCLGFTSWCVDLLVTLFF